MDTLRMQQEEDFDTVLNETLFEKLASNDPGQFKEAEDAINAYTRTKMREDGFMRRIMPPLPLTNDELDRQVDTDKAVKVVDKEPDSPAAVSVPLANLPTNFYIRGNRYKVTFDRIMTSRFTKDVSELRTWIMDIRQVLSDNAIKDMLAEEDSKFISTINLILIGSGQVVPTSGVPQYETISGAVTRDSLWDSMKVLPQTPSNLEVHTVLVNHITHKDIAKFGRNEMGGDFSQEIMKSGESVIEDFMGRRWIVTIKRNLVPNGAMYHFADPKFIGKHYSLEDTTMYIRREAFMIEFFAYQETGCTIGHTSSIARVDFDA